jgi:hypothetical protein
MQRGFSTGRNNKDSHNKSVSNVVPPLQQGKSGTQCSKMSRGTRGLAMKNKSKIQGDAKNTNGVRARSKEPYYHTRIYFMIKRAKGSTVCHAPDSSMRRAGDFLRDAIVGKYAISV